MDMRELSYLGLGAKGFHRVAYTQWGDGHNRRVAICVHGLSRNGRDFDVLAAALADRWRVLCPDVVGRGRSDWLKEPSLYGYPQYLSDMTALIARSGADKVDWVGTSMGGLIGMMMAAQPNSPIRRLVLNDVGPFVTKEALERIKGYVGKDPTFATLAGAETYVRTILAPFGRLTDARWRQLAETSVRPLEGGGFGLAYDPGIAYALQQGELTNVDLWAIWDMIKCPVLVLRGAASDLLLADTADQMQTRGPACKVIEIPGCGHAPSLMEEGQIAMVREFLDM